MRMKQKLPPREVWITWHPLAREVRVVDLGGRTPQVWADWTGNVVVGPYVLVPPNATKKPRPGMTWCMKRGCGASTRSEAGLCIIHRPSAKRKAKVTR